MPDNAPPFEPLLSKSLCSALLDISQYATENADQTILARPWADNVLVEAVRQPAATQPEATQPDFLFVAPLAVPTTVKTWSIPMAWWPKKALPEEFAKLLSFASLTAALVELRDEQSAFSTYVQRCLTADTPSLLSTPEVLLQLSAARSNQSDVTPPAAPTQTPG